MGRIGYDHGHTFSSSSSSSAATTNGDKDANRGYHKITTDLQFPMMKWFSWSPSSSIPSIPSISSNIPSHNHNNHSSVPWIELYTKSKVSFMK